MNKLMGFLELREANLPCVNWKKFEEDSVLDANKLWTVRCALYRGNDISLPRMVGKSASECMEFARSCSKRFRDNGLIVYYPYFIADKSGTLIVTGNNVTIEAVSGDLWNMVDNGKRDITIHINTSSGTAIVEGSTDFISESERKELEKCILKVKTAFKNEIFSNRGVLLEWSFARDCDFSGKPVGNPYLVFYEARSDGVDG